MYEPASGQRPPIVPVPARLPAVGRILWPAHDGDLFVVTLPDRPQDVVTMTDVRARYVDPVIAALGLPEGSYQLGARSVEVQDGAVRLPDGTLAGSATPLDACMRAFSAMTGAVEEAIDAVTSTPARLLGLDDGRGALVAGGRADVVLLDDELEVQATLVGGEVAFAADALAWD